MEGTYEAPGSSRDFEQGHNISLCAPSCILQNVRITFLQLYFVFIRLVVCFCCFDQLIGTLFVYPSSREELRKWFLSMENTLFRYRFRLESPESQVASSLFIM